MRAVLRGMYIGHINLEQSCTSRNEHFVRLVEALQQNGMRQYAVVRSTAIAKRLDILEGVTVGPVARSSVTAACLMPHVDVVHIHNTSARPAGLILRLTRSIPFVLTDANSDKHSRNPIAQSVYRRAAGIVAGDETDVAAHLQIYVQAADTLRVPMMLL